MIRVAIVEDDTDVRYSIEYFISQEDDMQVAGSFVQAEDFIDVYDDMHVDVVLMDITLPGISGIEAISRIKPLKPDVQFLIFSIHEDQERTYAALCAGATGYLLKSSTPEKVIAAIREIAGGGSPMSAQIARYVIRNFQEEHKSHVSIAAGLTTREKELLQALSGGYQYKEIADQMGISIETVRTYIRNIYEKLHVHSRTDAVNRVFPRKK